ncbi:MAG: DUF362 domain-containing protein [Desulfosalsimonas sp.]|uniref:DUF362 domain-containing protein n=1 Tax=Desulfosalsimonas sp. TaxID=3073848 RepID=UPI0039706D5D
MTSKVYFMDFRATYKDSGVAKLQRLMDTAGIDKCVGHRDLAALKLHFGELGNTAFIRPVFIGHIVDRVKQAGATPFLTDANTLYAGSRGDAPNHLMTAMANGFAYSVAKAPLVIADGLRGRTETAVQINKNRFKDVYIGTEIVNADCLISIAHFKGHELSGFGGAIKNVGMGSASRRGKMEQHSGLAPKVKQKKCIGCGECADHCASEAIDMVDEKAQINPERCIGCGECILICENGAIQIQWSQSGEAFLERMVEYTLGVLQNKTGKAFYINFINHVSPACDCVPYNDAPIVRDIGIVASTDPVAIDQASVDLVNQEPALPGSCLSTHTDAGADKFRGVYPDVDWTRQLSYAEELGLGRRQYELITI